MIKKISLITGVIVLAIGLGMILPQTLAKCPTTDCSTDCAEGTICGITQYDENGTKCSTTFCYGRGPDWDHEL